MAAVACQNDCCWRWTSTQGSPAGLNSVEDCRLGAGPTAVLSLTRKVVGVMRREVGHVRISKFPGAPASTRACAVGLTLSGSAT